ncbi:MAG: MFS transporter [Rhodobacteraceae bacterium]|jgi:MFS family permease|nr:MFS transporter [Paracoccaceae bacterium]
MSASDLPDADSAPGHLLSRNRNFHWFLVGRGSAMAAFQTLSVAVGWHIYDRTGEVIYLAWVGLCLFLPFLLLFLLVGVVADRVDRRAIISGATLAHGVAAALIGLWLTYGGPAVWPVLLCLTINGAAQAFLHPANQAMLASLVPREAFSRAVAASTSVTRIAQIGGPALGGLLIALVDTGTYGVVVAIYAVCVVAAWMIRADLRIRSKEPVSLAVLFGGFRHIVATRIVLAAVLIDLLAVFLGGVTGLLPAVATDILGVGPEGLGLMRATPAVGGLAVGLALARFGLPGHVGRWFFAALAAFGASIVVIGASPLLWLTLPALVVYGGADMISVYVRQTLVQMGTPDDLRGRVSAVNSVAINASNQMGDFRAGMVAALAGVPVAIVAGGLATLGVAALWYRIFPELRRLERL